MTGRPLCWHQRGQSPHKGNLGSRQPDLDRDSSAARPAPWQSFLLVMSSSTLHKPSSSSSSTTKVLPQKVRRNERERKRVHQVNLGFNRLRERVPNPSAASKKLSKVETLREAAKYIRRLQEVLVQTESFSHSPSFPPHSTPSCYSQASIIQSPPFNRYSFYSSPQLKTESPSSASSSTSFYSEPSLDESRMQFGQ